MNNYYMATTREPGLSNAAEGGIPLPYGGSDPLNTGNTTDDSGNILYYLLAFLGGLAVGSFIK